MITENAYAKINLALDVVGQREDGYHELKMIMLPIELHDVIVFEKSDHIELKSNIDIENNAILKTVHYMKDKYRVNQGVSIKLDKRIPIGAGLGGGSADISATLRGLNQLWGLNLDLKALEIDANYLGSDTLFCLYNRCAYVFGRGDKLKFLETPPIKHIYLFNPGIEVSTKVIFNAYKALPKYRKFENLLKYFTDKNYEKFFKYTYNDLSKTVENTYENVKKYKKIIDKIDKNAYMTGSGSTYFLLEFNENSADFYDKLRKSEIKYIKTTPKL
ncbi:4-(cytidine 5'-diphospho)-2-C-methyl-D-erythritol kinase [Mycoplasmatota bacterium]|nr:4-(cytidine 5'-diphospho)-2-C-methyl-D-erythritol kinase [Mycoplasmatota bacterium]